jgi:hypothetical protein
VLLWVRISIQDLHTFSYLRRFFFLWDRGISPPSKCPASWYTCTTFRKNSTFAKFMQQPTVRAQFVDFSTFSRVSHISIFKTSESTQNSQPNDSIRPNTLRYIWKTHSLRWKAHIELRYPTSNLAHMSFSQHFHLFDFKAPNTSNTLRISTWPVINFYFPRNSVYECHIRKQPTHWLSGTRVQLFRVFTLFFQQNQA